MMLIPFDLLFINLERLLDILYPHNHRQVMSLHTKVPFLGRRLPIDHTMVEGPIQEVMGLEVMGPTPSLLIICQNTNTEVKIILKTVLLTIDIIINLIRSVKTLYLQKHFGA